MTLPGKAVGAGRAVTVGEKDLLPPGPAFFSVGSVAAEGDSGALLCDGDFVSAGFSLVSVLQAVRAPMPTTAAAPATSAIRQVK